MALMEVDYSLIPKDKAMIVSVVSENMEGHKNEADTLRSLAELKDLLKTLDVQCCGEFHQNRKKLVSGTLVGSGKLKEIADLAKAQNVETLVFDFELTASQMRNIAQITELKVMDRCQVILQIFAHHAHTKEAKIQIEISRLKYMLPRLTSLWSHFSKQKGGIGMKGEGEQQLELDRRIIRKKIERYERELKTVQVSRNERKKNRSKNSLTAALVGYTNAGKSSLMNHLCQESVLSEDKLFATLDSTFRMLTPDTKPPLILIDTVGFLSNLPNTLIEGFKSTLESIRDADLLLVVGDISDPHIDKHIETTQNVLNELELGDKEKIFIFNKKDKVENILSAKVKTRKYPHSKIVSSLDKEDMQELRGFIINHFLEQQSAYDLFIPYDEGDAHSKVQKYTNIMKSSYHEKGIFYRVKTPEVFFKRTGIEKYNILDPNILEGFL